MLIVYGKTTHDIASIAGYHGPESQEAIDAIQVSEIYETQAEYRIYDNDLITQVWQAMDAGDAIELVFDGDTPTGIQIIDLPDPEPGA